MGRRCVGIGLAVTPVFAASVLLGGVSRAGASEVGPEPEAPVSETSAPLRVWYRSSEGCPEGSAFVARLAELGRNATLASVGDRVDFVVSLAYTPDTSSGRLERQTARGTVAIRELTAPRCADVAQALALSLDLALEPGPGKPGARAAPAPEPDVAPNAPSAAPAGAEPGPAEAALPSARDGVRFAFGAQLAVMSGLAPNWAPGAAVFGSVTGPGEVSLRLSLQGHWREGSIGSVELDVSWFGGRVEGCPLALGSGVLSFEPCAGVDVGVLSASSTFESVRTDRGLWLSGLALGRVRFRAWSQVALEAQLGAAVPFIRYSMGAESGPSVFRNEPVSVLFAFGVRWSS